MHTSLPYQLEPFSFQSLVVLYSSLNLVKCKYILNLLVKLTLILSNSLSSQAIIHMTRPWTVIKSWDQFIKQKQSKIHNI